MSEEKLEFDVYEVFAQTDAMSHHVHQFSLLASSEDMALTLAQENFFRRSEVLSIWVVRRDYIGRMTVKSPPASQQVDKSYRLKQSYGGLTEKWRRYKEQPLPPIAVDPRGTIEADPDE